MSTSRAVSSVDLSTSLSSDSSSINSLKRADQTTYLITSLVGWKNELSRRNLLFRRQ